MDGRKRSAERAIAKKRAADVRGSVSNREASNRVDRNHSNPEELDYARSP
jgi:hypothetical protein